MTPIDLVKTTYLGDRACKAVSLEGWRQRVVVHVSLISRIRSESGSWEYYSDEDIPDGMLVFGGVREVRFHPSGPVPNDVINQLVVTRAGEWTETESVHQFLLSVGCVDSAGETTEVTIEIVATDLYLQDPRLPGVEIRE